MTSYPTIPGVDRALRLASSRESAVALGALLAQVALLFAYILATGTVVLSTRQALYPFVWITLGLWLVLSLRAYGPAHDRSWLGIVVAVGYFLALAAIGDVIGLGADSPAVEVVSALPGWGPILVLGVPPVQFVLVPFEVLGYLALSYGVYRAVAARSGGVAAGLVGLFSCVGCSLGLLAGLAGAVGGATVAVQPGSFGYGPATGVFVLTVVLLVTAVPTRLDAPTRGDR